MQTTDTGGALPTGQLAYPSRMDEGTLETIHVEIVMKKLWLVLSATAFLLAACAYDDSKEEAEIKQYKDQPLQRDGDRLNPRRD